MTVTVAPKLARSVRADILAVSFGPTLPVAVREALRARDYKGNWGTADLIVAPSPSPVPFLGVVGLGKDKDPARRAEALRRGLGKIVADAQQHALKVVALDVSNEADADTLARAAVEAASLSTYAFTEHKKSLARQQQARGVRTLVLVVGTKQLAVVKQVVREAQQVMAGVKLTRDLVSEPASHMKPKTLVDVAKQIATADGVTLKVMNRSQAQTDGWRAFLAVAAGSAEEPYVIHLTYKPAQPAQKKIVVVGKGITFDSGGLSLKPATSMEYMKADMAGGATMLGVFLALAKLKLPVEVHGVIAACENMPSGSAYRPGDVVQSRSGKTIEILNTDAEGRVTLADALHYAVQLKPDAVVDLATLTGACVVGLGETYAGLFSNNKPLNDALLAAAQRAGEGLEDLPLPEEYKQLNESKIADVNNAPGNRYGGAITAALFLQEFVGKTAWAHLDIAGPAYTDKPLISYWQYGGTGYGVRTLIEFLKRV